jgi:hypothetical protein
VRLNKPGFLMPSHCTIQPFAFDTTTYYQERRHSGTGYYLIGWGLTDPPLFTCWEDAQGCRNSDAAVALYGTWVTHALGRIARPASRNSSWPYEYHLASPDSVFEIVGEFDWAIDGEIMEKVGRTTSWTGGSVIDGCLTVGVNPEGSPNRHSIRCAMHVDAEAGQGDSGAPVFEITSGTQVELRGTVFASDSVGCGPIPDPVFSGTVRVCDRYFASNLGGIKEDLDPEGDQPLVFWNPTPPMSVQIRGPIGWPAYEEVEVLAVVSNGTPPFTYEWEVDGSPACGNQNTCSATMGGPGTSVSFWVKVTDGDHHEDTDTHVVMAMY